MARERQLPPDREAAWTPQSVANRRRCAMPLIGEQEILLRTGLEASDAEVADISA